MVRSCRVLTPISGRHLWFWYKRSGFWANATGTGRPRPIWRGMPAQCICARTAGWPSTAPSGGTMRSSACITGKSRTTELSSERQGSGGAMHDGSPARGRLRPRRSPCRPAMRQSRRVLHLPAPNSATPSYVQAMRQHWDTPRSHSGSCHQVRRPSPRNSQRW